MLFNTTSATVDREIGHRGFGFVRAMHNGVEIQIFTRGERLLEVGLKTSDFKEGERVSLDYEKNPKGLYRTVRIHPAQGTVVKSVPITIDQFLNPIKFGENLATGEVLWRIMNRDGEFVQYIVCSPTGLMLRQLGSVISNDARINIGLEAKVMMGRRGRVAAQARLLAAE